MTLKSPHRGQPPMGFQLGMTRFLELEQRVGDIENVLELMQQLLKVNNASLQTIIDAINREKVN